MRKCRRPQREAKATSHAAGDRGQSDARAGQRPATPSTWRRSAGPVQQGAIMSEAPEEAVTAPAWLPPGSPSRACRLDAPRRWPRPEPDRPGQQRGARATAPRSGTRSVVAGVLVAIEVADFTGGRQTRRQLEGSAQAAWARQAAPVRTQPMRRPSDHASAIVARTRLGIESVYHAAFCGFCCGAHAARAFVTPGDSAPRAAVAPRPPRTGQPLDDEERVARHAGEQVDAASTLRRTPGRSPFTAHADPSGAERAQPPENASNPMSPSSAQVCMK